MLQKSIQSFQSDCGKSKIFLDSDMPKKSMQSFQSDCGKAKVFVDSDMPIGIFHDFLMELKGAMVDRMVEFHKQQQEMSESQKQREIIEDQNQQLSQECCKEE